MLIIFKYKLSYIFKAGLSILAIPHIGSLWENISFLLQDVDIIQLMLYAHFGTLVSQVLKRVL